MPETVDRQRTTCARTLFVGAGYALVVLGLWGVYGINNGFYWETGLIYPSDINPGWKGSLYIDPLRQFTALFYHLSYVMGAAAGERGSFVPYQLVYATLWVFRAILTYLIVRRLMPDQSALAIFAGLFAALHAADASLNFIGQLNQFGFVFLMLLSFLLLLIALESGRTFIAIMLAAGSALFGYLTLWSYESPLPVMLAFPIATLLLKRDIAVRRISLVFSLYFCPIAIFIYENARRYLTSYGDGTLTYQARVVRQDFSLVSALSDLRLHVENSIMPWHWPYAFLSPQHTYQYGVASIPVFIAILFLTQMAITEQRALPQAFRINGRLLLFAVLSCGLLVASYAIILLLDGNRQLGRTEFLPSFAAACLLSAILYAPLSLVREQRFLRVLALLIPGMFGIFSVVAGVNSGFFFHAAWERHRSLISSIVFNAPRVSDGTLFVLRNIDPNRDPFAHNMWFDVALRLAYPGTIVGGVYTIAPNVPARGTSIDLRNGQPHLLPDQHLTLLHYASVSGVRHVIAFDYDPASGGAVPVANGPLKFGNGEIAAGRYSYCAAVTGARPDPIAVRRYGPIVGAHKIDCTTE